MAQKQKWTLSAVYVAPAMARKAIRDFLSRRDLPETTIADILLCVSEAVTNVVYHAYRDSAQPGDVHVQACLNSDLCISVRDTGGGMKPRTDSPGIGLGLPMISTLAREIEIRSAEDTGTEVLMKFGLPG